MESESSTGTGFPYRFCYNCKYLLFSKDQSHNLLPRLDEVTCAAEVCVNEQGCVTYSPEIGQSLMARYVKYTGYPHMQHHIYWEYGNED